MIWGDMFNSEVTSWLYDRGFRDFAGSTVVHGVGGWAGLTAILMLGARTGRFDRSGNPKPLPSHSPVLSLVGVLLLLFCWLGFNGGTISPQDPLLQRVLLNTLTAAAFGSLFGMVIGAWIDKGIFNPARICNGLIGSLVATTAAVNTMSTIEAMIVGAMGGALATVTGEILLQKFKIDDPVDVIATHGVAGAFGTLAVACVGPVSALPTGSRISQFGIQLGGVLTIFGFVCISTWLTLLLIGRFISIRVSVADEKLGLNYTEHGESVGTARLQQALESKTVESVSFGIPLDVASNDEHTDLAASMNKLLEKYAQRQKQLKLSEKRFHHFAETASNWLWETNEKLEFTFFSANSSDDAGNQSALGEPLLDTLQLDEIENHRVRRNLVAKKATGVFEARMQFDSTNHAAIVQLWRSAFYCGKCITSPASR